VFALSNTEVRSRSHCWCETATSIIYSQCVSVALVIQHETRILIILSSVAWPGAPYFSTLSHKRHDIRGGKNTKH